MKKTIKLIVTGTVQGVGFRWSVKEIADKLNVQGYVQNLSDGSVKIIASIKNDDISKFLKQIKNSSSSIINVVKIKKEILNYKDYQNFSIKI
ncbi:acylphosphatase [Apilactobacillus apisilvae]|uniref:acylphosphatase n=1 Tax=Apilactobacillus apisilvae TaxID=2923364 RepID=A0ABY4PIP1_9LACO|nr:acylphosphatase [Apilactobacillus apisilvae]UQS85287.1 acylphosphatase [Apilactobacillus apisilvae]